MADQELQNRPSVEAQSIADTNKQSIADLEAAPNPESSPSNISTPTPKPSGTKKDDEKEEAEAVAEQTLTHEMQPKESLIPENKPENQAQEQQQNKQEQEEDRSNQLGSNLSMRPKPQPKPEPSPQEQKQLEFAKQRSHELTKQMVTSQQHRQNWMNKPNLMRRIENRLARDPAIAKVAFIVAGGAAGLASMDPKSQFNVLKNAKAFVQNLTRQALNANQLNQTDLTNPFNLNAMMQNNPNSIANLNLASQQAAVNAQNDDLQNDAQLQNQLQQQEQDKETSQAESDEQANMSSQAELDEENNEYNDESNANSPSPKPGAQADDEELKEGEEEFGLDAGVDAFKDDVNSQALSMFMEDDSLGVADMTNLMSGAEMGATEMGAEAGAELAAEAVLTLGPALLGAV